MGTGVAERKVLGVASKEKIDDIIASGRYYEEAFGRDSKHFPTTGLRRTAAYGKAGAMGIGAKDRANGIGLDYTEGALAFKAKDHRPIASLGVTQRRRGRTLAPVRTRRARGAVPAPGPRLVHHGKDVGRGRGWEPRVVRVQRRGHRDERGAPGAVAEGQVRGDGTRGQARLRVPALGERDAEWSASRRS